MPSKLRIGIVVLVTLAWLTACGDSKPAPDIDATVEARVTERMPASAELTAPETTETGAAKEKEAHRVVTEVSAAEIAAAAARQEEIYREVVEDSFAEVQAVIARQEEIYRVAVEDSFAEVQAVIARQEEIYRVAVEDSFAEVQAATARQQKGAQSMEALVAVAESVAAQLEEAHVAAMDDLDAAAERAAARLEEAYDAAKEALGVGAESAAARLEEAYDAAKEALGVGAKSAAARLAGLKELHVEFMDSLAATAESFVTSLEGAHVGVMQTLAQAVDTGAARLAGSHIAAVEGFAQVTTVSMPTAEGPAAVPQRDISFAGVVTRTNLPSQVQVVFSLRDRDGHAIVLPAEDVQKATQIFERGTGTEDWEEIDYTETSFFVHTAENFDLEVVFVLDFTNSMALAMLPDGRSGIAAMLEAFNAGLSALPGAHRIGVVEFHDRNVEPGVLSALTTNREAILERTSRFSQSNFDPGSSRVWDSVVAGADLFSTPDQNPRAVRALVFLSDGRDTSSVHARDDARHHAQARGVQLYAVGVGEVFQEEELREMGGLTGGGYYPARDVSLLQEQLQLLVSDLRGQYQVSYITLRRAGEYRVRVAVELDDVSGSMQTAPFDAATFFGPDNQGVIQFDPPSIDSDERQVTAFLRVLHLPRNVDRIRFKADTSKPLAVELVARQDGGLLDGWTLSGPDAGGFYEASSPDPLEFGNLGLLFKLTVSDVTEQFLYIPFEFDNAIYTAGKSLGGRVPLTIDPRQIAFSSNRDGNPEIYVMNADGSGVTRLTDHPGEDWDPKWSPDGQQIAFNSDRAGNMAVYVMNADGSDVTRLTDHPARHWQPDWSPDGQQIAFTSDRDGNMAIYAMNADGSDVARLTDHPARHWQPAWSPDSQQVAFTSDRDGKLEEIYVMNADGSGVTRLTDHPGKDRDPKWSPDGQRIAFVSDRDGSLEIYVMNADGSDVEQLTDNFDHDYAPAWSPDGQQIAFTSDRDGPPGIYVMNGDGSDVRQLTDNTADDWASAWWPQ